MRRPELILVTILDLLPLLLDQIVKGVQIRIVAICLNSIAINFTCPGLISLMLLDVLLSLVESLRYH